MDAWVVCVILFGNPAMYHVIEIACSNINMFKNVRCTCIKIASNLAVGVEWMYSCGDRFKNSFSKCTIYKYVFR